MAYLFDVGHFVESLRLSCPQLRLYNSTNDATKAIGLPTTFTMGFFPELLDEIKMTKSSGIALLTHPERWKKKLYEWLGEADTSMGPTGRQTKGPFVLELGRSYLSFPVSFDPDDFVASFGNILKFRADTRQLATTTLRRMAERFNFESTLRKGVAAAGTSLPSAENPGVLENAYFGAHLRVEKDAMFYWDPNGDYWGWTKYDKQTAAYTEQATKANLSLIYVASGETEHVERFRNESATRGITVINKQDVLGKDVEKLDRLKWDQQALVDFLVMLRASQFGGMSHSSFAWNVALKRHLHVKDAANKSHLDGPQMLSDELSQVYGKPKEFAEYASCMWP
ncbi:hypothetical protein CTA2_4617 [Colletotrichum tanaceti]|nr:hypothetical protein CTA2_4617 [Colletotrichum tanaceti]